jgi:hypothetical protein
MSKSSTLIGLLTRKESKIILFFKVNKCQSLFVLLCNLKNLQSTINSKTLTTSKQSLNGPLPSQTQVTTNISQEKPKVTYKKTTPMKQHLTNQPT